MSSERRTEASVLLSKAAQKLEALAWLRWQLKSAWMRRPGKRKAIDDMVTALLKEEADDIKHKDFFTDEFNKNRKKSDLTAKIEDLDAN